MVRIRLRGFCQFGPGGKNQPKRRYHGSIHEPTGKAVCADTGNPDLHGLDLANKIICLPGTTGSTSSGAVWSRLAKLGVAPLAMLFSLQIDSLAAGGLIVADIWAGKRIITVDRLGDAFLDAIKNGDTVTIHVDGTVKTGGRA